MSKLVRRYWQAIVAALVTLLITSVITWFIDNKYENESISLQTLSSVAALFTSLLIFGTAWTLHQKYNASQQMIDKKAMKVLELVTALQSVSLTIRFYEEKPERSNEVFNIRPTIGKLNSVDDSLSSNNKTIKRKHYFDSSVMDLYEELVAVSTDIFMPKAIAKVIGEKLDIENMFSVETIAYNKVKKNDIVLYSNKIPSSRIALYASMIINPFSPPDKVVEKYNKAEVNADRLINDLRYIHAQAIKWLRKNSPYSLEDLNIDNKRS